MFLWGLFFIPFYIECTLSMFFNLLIELFKATSCPMNTTFEEFHNYFLINFLFLFDVFLDLVAYKRTCKTT